MLKYLVAEISGRQYLVEPGKIITVDHLGDLKTLECDKILMKVEGERVEIGAPYLGGKVIFDVVEVVRQKKIRVATYKAKANTRKVRGSRRIVSRIKLQAKETKIPKMREKTA